MTLLNKATTNTSHFSDIQFQLMIRADAKWYGILILLLYLAAQLLLTGTEVICNVHSTM